MIKPSEIKILYSEIDEEIDLGSHEQALLDYDLLIKAINERVEYLLEKDPSLLFSYLYRLDVSEQKLQFALGPKSSDAVQAIAQLIFERQMDRVRSKQKYKQDPIDGWNW